jgi:hypothetical protein
MTLLTSQVPAVTDYLVTTAQASTSLGASTTAPVVVVDGEDVTQDLRANQRLLWIGFDPLNPGQAAASAAQDWPNLDQGRAIDEDGEITCAAQYWSGSTAMKFNRDGCAAIAGAFAALLRGTPAAGGPGDTQMGGLVFWSRVAAWEWSQQQLPSGAAVMCVFKVLYRARLTAS